MAARTTIAIALAVALGLLVSETRAGTNFTFGDVNCDESVDSSDALQVLQFHLSLQQQLYCRQNADLDGDGVVGVVDALLILQFDAGSLNHLPPLRVFVGEVILARGVEADCEALDTGETVYVLWDPTTTPLGDQVMIVGFVNPHAGSICAVGPVLYNVTVLVLG